jgi:phage tail-like protein
VTVAAVAHPLGNRITITWTGPATARFRLLCRRGGYPAPAPGGWLGDLVADTAGPADATPQVETTPDGYRVDHVGLPAEIVHYYQLLTPDPADAADPQAWVGDPADRASAMATGPYLFAERLYQLLPGVYRRFDADVAPPAAAGQARSELRGEGQLRRFLELVGGQLDQIYSTVRSLSGLANVQEVDGRLLPLLAHWIGWRVDHGLGYADQRRQIADAPAVYQAVQTVAALEATARRVTGWPCVAKELVDNVAVTNRPERLNLWLLPPGGAAVPELLSLDDAGEGRPAVARHRDGTVRLVYATTKNGLSELWEKIRATDGTWAPSAPVVTGPGAYHDPAAAVLGGTALLLWSAYLPGAGWRIEYRFLDDGRWGPAQTFTAPDRTQRRDPAAVVEGDGDAAALWLFWRERSDDGPWRLRYQRRTGPAWAPDPDGIRDFPPDARVDSGVSAALREGQLWLWWARRTPVDSGGTRWRCVFRVKDTTADDADGWGAVTELAADAGHHDREPAGHVDATGGVTVLLSSTRDGGWSVWRVPIDAQARSWGQPAAVTGAVFTDRSPVVVPVGDDQAAIVYRSSQSVTYPDERYRASTTVDRRYSGTVTVPATNQERLALRGTVDDVIAYTWNTAAPQERIARQDGPMPVAPDVVALFLDPGGADGGTVDAAVDRLTAILPEFLPITVRATLVIGRPPA